MLCKFLPIPIIVMVAFGFFFVNHIAIAGDMAGAKSMLENAEKQQIAVPQIKNIKGAEEITKIFNSKEYQTRLHNEINRLKAQLDPKSEPEQKKSAMSKGENSFLMPDERIYLFVSSSLPISTLKNYAADLDKIRDPNITMVMRGFVNGIHYIKPTLQFIETILTKDANCDPLSGKCDAYHTNINIDPMLFSKYAIESVPAIVYARGINAIDMEKARQGIKENAISDAYLLSGDVSFEYALEVIEKESKSSQIRNVLKKLRRGFY